MPAQDRPPERAAGTMASLTGWAAETDLYSLAVGLGIFLGVFVRAQFVFSWDFPLNDGGLFYQMTRELQEASYRLPAFTTYNGLETPYAYPPLGFYLSAALDQWTPLDLFDVLRYVPLAASCLMLVAFTALARDLLRSRTAIAVAVFAFALVPRSFIWMLMGGGVTRAPGLLFALLALHQIYLMFTREGRWHVVLASLLSALAVLSHLQAGSFLAFSAIVFLVAYGLHRRGAVRAGIVGTATLVLTAPWWGTVIATHGVAPFLAANETGGSVFSSAELREYLIGSLLRLGSTSEPLFPLIATLAFLGMVACIVRHWFILPAWWATIVLMDARAFQTFATVPVAMLAGIGLTEVLLPVVLRSRAAREAVATSEGVPVEDRFLGVTMNDALRSWAPALLAIFLWYAINGALMRSGEAGTLVALSPDERAALAWVDAETPRASRVLVVSGEGWQVDKTSEWFPVLTGRVSVATVQGSEWVGDRYFFHRVGMHNEVYACAFDNADCLVEWRRATSVDYDYVFVPKPPYGQCCDHLLATMRNHRAFSIEYDGPGATVFRRVG